MPRETDQIRTLITGCCNNDRNCQRMLYQWLFDYAMKISYRYIHQQEEAEEMVHEAFIKLFKNINRFELNREGDTEALLKGWFKRIVVNTCIDQLRKVQLKIISMDNNTEQDGFTDHQETGLDKMAYDEIIDATRQLTPVYRTVFNLFVIEGLSHDEISQALQISVGASKSNLSKAKNNLRKIIAERSVIKTYV
ncbi:RNA polymerase sigma factor [Sediminibacterium sp.]|uniref:RNA polymerase sigma factor n=1 Tax=Sediminibacterium sp. TaxID=1917865 RepID=UPI002600D006|nr:RNA polymerase sigma factor [Sediminibacterium sp.]MBW0179208.1 RNA polymerase sigma factor [Sediminibacterium sp.]